jgi:hypothetical protein
MKSVAATALPTRRSCSAIVRAGRGTRDVRVRALSKSPARKDAVRSEGPSTDASVIYGRLKDVST